MRWLWAHGADWRPYDDATSAQLEQAFSDPDVRHTRVHVSPLAAYDVDLQQMLQIHPTTRASRPIRRESREPFEEWDVLTDSGWQPFDPAAASLLTAASRYRRGAIQLRVPPAVYEVDLRRLSQTNVRTRRERPVRRRLFHERFAPAAADLPRLTAWEVVPAGGWEAGAIDPIVCSALGEEGEEVVRLPCDSEATRCVFNRSTVERALEAAGRCPRCGAPYGTQGAQPAGSMRAWAEGEGCEGHEGCGAIVVAYDFPAGVQRAGQPEPGRAYAAARRRCFLPDDATGRRAVRLLREAFVRGVLFRVGKSLTTGEESAVVWNLHQKTSRKGGPTRHGWPDETYLMRLESECAAVNVMLDD
ncbi:hypothetical protein AB1Y20_002746 [Prymnesium parvum]|uniref:RING-type E3 ubiquitin transferase n=1 Tax=Prymnesium parvum TaxID=97485 RepID=A0AB34JCN5_PRYPA